MFDTSTGKCPTNATISKTQCVEQSSALVCAHEIDSWRLSLGTESHQVRSFLMRVCERLTEVKSQVFDLEHSNVRLILMYVKHGLPQSFYLESC